MVLQLKFPPHISSIYVYIIRTLSYNISYHLQNSRTLDLPMETHSRNYQQLDQNCWNSHTKNVLSKQTQGSFQFRKLILYPLNPSSLIVCLTIIFIQLNIFLTINVTWVLPNPSLNHNHLQIIKLFRQLSQLLYVLPPFAAYLLSYCNTFYEL